MLFQEPGYSFISVRLAYPRSPSGKLVGEAVLCSVEVVDPPVRVSIWPETVRLLGLALLILCLAAFWRRETRVARNELMAVLTRFEGHVGASIGEVVKTNEIVEKEVRGISAPLRSLRGELKSLRKRDGATAPGVSRERSSGPPRDAPGTV